MTPINQWRAHVVVGLAVALGAVAPACGNKDGDGRSLGVRATLAAAIQAFERGDAAALCEVISPAGRQVIGLTQHGSEPFECEQDVGGYLASLQPYRNGSRPELVAVRRSTPRRAVAAYRLPGGMRATIALGRDGDGSWGIDGLFDATVSRVQVRTTGASRSLSEAELRIEGKRPDPLPVDGRVTVRDRATGRRCGDVLADRFPKLAGGCRIQMIGRPRLSLQTPFGFTSIARCVIQYDLQVDGAGRAWLVEPAISGTSPCLDFDACLDTRQEVVPWQARIEAGPAGPLRLRVQDVCIDSCYGRFEGPWQLELIEDRRGGWRALSHGTVGTSGLRFDGSAGSVKRPFAVETGA